jgi:hypothetical protein
MPNGNGVASGGSFNYWDLDYTGSGSTNVDNAPLSGGLGDLTDGYVETQNWNLVENGAGTGPYVGWRALNPLILFTFGLTVNIDTVTIHADDSNGFGGVSPPSSIDFGVAGGPLTNYPVVDPGSGAPFAIVLSGLSFSGTQFEMRINRSNEWVFVSEIEFDGTHPDPAPVPEPATFFLGAAGLVLTALQRRRNS